MIDCLHNDILWGWGRKKICCLIYLFIYLFVCLLFTSANAPVRSVFSSGLGHTLDQTRSSQLPRTRSAKPQNRTSLSSLSYGRRKTPAQIRRPYPVSKSSSLPCFLTKTNVSKQKGDSSPPLAEQSTGTQPDRNLPAADRSRMMNFVT